MRVAEMKEEASLLRVVVEVPQAAGEGAGVAGLMGVRERSTTSSSASSARSRVKNISRRPLLSASLSVIR